MINNFFFFGFFFEIVIVFFLDFRFIKAIVSEWDFIWGICIVGRQMIIIEMCAQNFVYAFFFHCFARRIKSKPISGVYFIQVNIYS